MLKKDRKIDVNSVEEEVKMDFTNQSANDKTSGESLESIETLTSEVTNIDLAEADITESINASCIIKKDCNVKYDLKTFNPSISKSIGRAIGATGVLTLVYAKTGVRLSLSDEVYSVLGFPTNLQVSYKGDILAISEKLPITENSYNIKKNGSKAIIYSSPLIKEIVDYFKLDFSDRTSLTFHDVEYMLDDEYPVAFIKIK